MKKVLVIGGSGYLGARISKYLAEIGFEVFVLCRSIPKHSAWQSLMSGFIIGDITKKEVLDTLLTKEFDIAIHLVSLDNQNSQANPNFVSSVNVLSTWNILRVLSERGLKTFVYFSTIHVYGNFPKTLISEDSVPKPISAYGLTHLLSENISNYYNQTSKTNCINIRCSNSYGSPVFKESECWWLVLNDFCKTAYEKERIIINSDGSPLRDFVHWFDILSALELILKNSKYNIYHIATGETLSILELAQKVKDIYYKRYNKKISIDLPNHMNKLRKKELKRHSFSIKRLHDIGFKRNKEISWGINEIFDFMENV